MNRISDSLRVLLWSSVFIYVVVSGLQITQVDIWWQLSEGAQILRTGHLPTGPVAAFGLPAQPYFDEYAGYEVVLATLYQLTGFPGIWIAFIAVYLTILFLPSLYLRKANPLYDVFSCLALLTAGILMKDRLEQRPELVGSFLQVLLMVWLRASKLEAWSARSAWLLFLIFVAWTNTHSSFLFGVFTLGLWLACELALKFRTEPVPVLLKNGIRFAMVVALALVLNPYGAERLTFPFRQALDPGSTALSPEMWPILALNSVPGISWLVAVALLAWAMVTSRATPVWLVLFSFFAACMAYASFRCVSLLAIALLFVYAARDGQVRVTASRSTLLGLAQGGALAALCVFMIFGDAFTFVLTLNEMRAERHFATHANQFAPELVDRDVLHNNRRMAVICGHGEGAYLSFDPYTNFYPVIDSGLAHFSDESKHYFFFLAHEPEALGSALTDLKAEYVVINSMSSYRSFYWVLKIEQAPGWRMIACSPNGMLWQRTSGGRYLPDEADRTKIEAMRDYFLKLGDPRSAFCYSTLLGNTGDSLALLALDPDPAWADTFFNFFSDWVVSLPPDVIQDFLTHRDSGNDPMMDAVLHAQLGPESFAEFAAKSSLNPKPFLWHLIEARMDLARGNRDQARTIIDSISSIQPSVAFYKARLAIHGGDRAGGLSAYGQWQTWDDHAKEAQQATSVQLNGRIDALSAAASR